MYVGFSYFEVNIMMPFCNLFMGQLSYIMHIRRVVTIIMYIRIHYSAVLMANITGLAPNSQWGEMCEGERV